MAEVANNLRRLQRFDEEIILRQQIVEAVGRNAGPESQFALVAEMNLGICLGALGRYEEAELLLARVDPALEAGLGLFDPVTLQAHSWRSHVAVKLGKLEEARLLQEQLLAAYELNGLGGSPEGIKAALNLSNTLMALEQPIPAAQLLRQALELRTQSLGLDDPATLDVMQFLATALFISGEVSEARLLARSLVDGRSRVFGVDDNVTIRSRAFLAKIEGAVGED
jgi:tetratricopeptide (TPR) repeat protein